ncbi:MAG: 4Fe-4S dicluster domain-containing protein [Candidatus Omnitrophica bacterium]|nr:4Fe-4S dicluster domain-containing protein [Candidatus Omnitrophota bacterium]
MKRKIIKIDEEKCTGCGECIVGCPEGALQLIDGKARLVSANYCDGLGACIGTCPVNAITIEERDVPEYDERVVIKNIIKQGDSVVKAHLKHLKEHGQDDYYNIAVQVLKEEGKEDLTMQNSFDHGHAHAGGCPGSRMMDFSKEKKNESSEKVNIGSELQQWPIQLHLIGAHAPYFKDADLLVAADCVAHSFGNFHQKFLKGRKLVILCPKLDEGQDMYLEKLTELFKINNIKSVTCVRMEVPCCYGTQRLVEEALRASGKQTLIKEYVISIGGEIV